MADDQPQIYLITPSEIELSSFPDRLAACLDAVAVACVRLSMASRDEDRIAKMADALREVTHARDVALVIDSHLMLVERLGLDGVHLTDAARSVKAARKALGDDAIVGTFCAASRHDGLTADWGPITSPLARLACQHWATVAAPKRICSSGGRKWSRCRWSPRGRLTLT